MKMEENEFDRPDMVGTPDYGARLLLVVVLLAAVLLHWIT